MTTIDKTKPVLVSGGAGYIASWLIRYLLEQGSPVRASVRDKSNTEKCAHLNKLSEEFPGKLELFEADLLKDGSFDQAMAGCELVMHTASPFQISGISDPQKQLIDPALKGTANVLEAANKNESVKRVVLTSSVAAIMGDNTDADAKPDRTMTEADWNASANISHQAYSYSKTLAEKEAWKINEAQSRWDLVVINPAFVLGPSLSERADGASVDFMRSMVNGKYKSGVPALTFGVVDVRDVARAHMLAGYTPKASGRHITSAETMSFLDIANSLRDSFGDKYPIPKGGVPKFMLYLVGPFMGFSWKYISNNIDVPYKLDNSYGVKDLGIKYRPTQETFKEHIEQLETAGMIQ